ncbi:response regulator [Mesoterricola sediminis]|uniref:Hpt domain-containing protein n=1 Tax=Mesoterricola sediminis TaxID=2927980 RepID=A0AA48GV03_9BACT|nr:response regulator [Mesoterricola sediminis]BDU78294.1 hypothetical protein METESE_32520 [Mesoterricola sediminis]
MNLAEEGAHLADLADQLEDEALALDSGGDASHVHLLFRTVHNLKSLAGFAGLRELAGVFHRLEDGLDRIRRGREDWTSAWSDEVFRSIDLTRQVLDQAQDLAPGEGTGAAPAPGPATAQAGLGLPLTPEQTERLEAALRAGHGIYRIEKLFRQGLDRETFDTLPVMEDVAEAGSLLAMHPGYDAYAAGPEEQVLKLLFASPRTREELERTFFDPLIEVQAPHPLPEGLDQVPGARFLIVEDDAASSTVLAHIVKRFGACMVTGTAREGYTQFTRAWDRGEPYQVCFLDLHLPDLSGLAILSALRRFESERRIPRSQRCRVLVTTASESVDDIKASLVFDADGYLVKPVDPAVIEEKIALIREAWMAET